MYGAAISKIYPRNTSKYPEQNRSMRHNKERISNQTHHHNQNPIDRQGQAGLPQDVSAPLPPSQFLRPRAVAVDMPQDPSVFGLRARARVVFIVVLVFE